MENTPFAKASVALILFAFVTVFIMYPIPLHISSLVIGRPFEDAFESIWYLYWYKHALLDLRVFPLFQPDVFYPTGWDLGFATMPPLYPILLVPITALVGHVAAYNISLIGSCIFAAFGVFLLCRAVGATVWGSIIGGIAFAFYPNRQVYLGGFLNLLLGSMWLPWVLYGLFQAGHRPKFRTRWLAFAGLAFSMSIAGAWQFAFISSGLVLVFGSIYLWPVVRREWRTWIHPIGCAILICCLIAVPFLWNGYLVRSRVGAATVFPLSDLERTSVSLERLFVPSALNPLVWNLSRNAFPLVNGEDGVVTFGIVPALFALVALIRVRPWSALVRGLWISVLVGLVLMMGPTLHFWGKPVSVRLPGSAVVERLAPMLAMPDGSLKIPLPALLLYRLIQPFRSFHHFGRWGLIVSLGIAVLSSLGFTYVLGRFGRRWQTVLGVVFALFLMIEFNSQPLPSITSTEQMRRGVDSWLAAQSEQSIIIEYPLSYSMKGQSLYYTIAHGQKTVHGYSIVLPAGFPEMLSTLKQWPDNSAIDLLDKIGVRYVLVHAFEGDDFEEKVLPVLRSIDRLRLIERFATPIGPVRDIFLFELNTEPDDPPRSSNTILQRYEFGR